MAKNFVSLNNNFGQYVTKLNQLVNKVGDLALLSTTADSDLVGAINEALTASGVDSASIISLLDSGQYLAFPNLTAATDADFVLTFNSQTITGAKTFTSKAVFQNQVTIGTNSTDGTLTIRDVSPSVSLRDSASNNIGSISTGSSAFNFTVDAANAVGGSAFVFNIDGGSVARVDPTGTIGPTTLLTRNAANSRYLLDSNTVATVNIINSAVGTNQIADSAVTTGKIANLNVTTGKIANSAVTNGKIANDAVSRSKLLDEVQLIIYDSTGAPVKTLYGAGS